MFSIEPVTGKSLTNAADVIACQMRYVAAEALALRDSRARPEELRQFLGDVEAIRRNLRDFIATADVRLTALGKGVELHLSAIPSPPVAGATRTQRADGARVGSRDQI